MLTNDLCSACGLCCSGWIFPNVERPGAPVLPQPCVFHEGDRCRCYDDRPAGCRTFACETLQRARSGELTDVEARGIVADGVDQVRAIDRELRRSGWAEADEPGSLAWRRFVEAARQHGDDIEFRRRHAPCLLLVAAYFSTIQRSFVIDYVF